MMYYIEISQWNLLESFVTESLSPFSFYSEREFGNNLSRYLSGDKEKANYLILSSEDLGGDISLIVDESLIDANSLLPIPKMKKAFTYPKTIYFKKGFVRVRFNSIEIKDNIVAESKILLEVKCIEKYISSFTIKNVALKNRTTITKLKESFSFEKQKYVEYDNKYNKYKGALVGYIRGQLTTSVGQTLELQNKLRDLKNAFGGLNTQIMTTDSFNDNSNILMGVNECKSLYTNSIGDIPSFDILLAQYSEIVKLAKMRSNEIKNYNILSSNFETENRIADIKSRIKLLEQQYHISEAIQELNSIKALEIRNGRSDGKTRKYFKKGTIEYMRKQQLKEIIDNFEKYNEEYKTLKGKLNQYTNGIDNDFQKYDATISAIFIRISDIMNDLISNASKTTYVNNINLSNIILSDAIYIKNESHVPEITYFNILLDCILTKNISKQISEYQVIQIIEESAQIFKNTTSSETEKGQVLLQCLREFWAYKNQRREQYSIPQEMPILQSIMAFFIKPSDFEQIERYMMIKRFSHKEFAFMLWGAWIGFADIPKTFTNVVYQNEKVTDLIEEKLDNITLGR